MNELQQIQAKNTEVAIVEAQWSIAKMSPRDESAAQKKILASCDRVLFAESAHYLYKRQSTEVKGPTIRAAEHMARAWGNIDFGYKILQEADGVTIGEAYCIDLESNTKQSRRFVVPHMRYTKRGSYAVTDPRDISEMVSSRGMRQVRSCILSMIPTDIVDEFNEKCDKTILASIGDIAEARAKLSKAFAEFGVAESAIGRFAKKALSEINPYDVLRLRRIYTSIKDGSTRVNDWFDVPTDTASPMEAIIKAKQEAAKEAHGESLADQAAVKRAKLEPVSAAPAVDEAPVEKEDKPKRTRKMNANEHGVLMATIGRIAGAFERADITRLDIARRLGKSLDLITPEEVEDLRADMKLIKAGSATAHDLGYVVAESAQAEATTTDETQAETQTESAPKQMSLEDEIRSKIEAAKSAPKQMSLEDEIRSKIEAAKPGTTDLDDIEELLQDKDEELGEEVLNDLYAKVVDKYREQSAADTVETS